MPLTKARVAFLIANRTGTRSWDLRDHFITLALYDTGIRVSEACHLELPHID